MTSILAEFVVGCNSRSLHRSLLVSSASASIGGRVLVVIAILEADVFEAVIENCVGIATSIKLLLPLLALIDFAANRSAHVSDLKLVASGRCFAITKEGCTGVLECSRPT